MFLLFSFLVSLCGIGLYFGKCLYLNYADSYKRYTRKKQGAEHMLTQIGALIRSSTTIGSGVGNHFLVCATISEMINQIFFLDKGPREKIINYC